MGRPSKWGEVDYAARLAGLADANGYDRQADTRTLYPAPEAELVEADGGLGVQDPGMPGETSDAGGLLEGFVRLADADPEEILVYARRFGLLRLCRHGLPHHHRPQPYPLPRETISLGVLDHLAGRGMKPSDVLEEAPLAYWCRPVDVEPLSLWRRYAGQARALLAIAARVQRGKVGLEEDWQQVYRSSGREAPWWDQSQEADRSVLARVLDEWMQMTGARPVVSWRRGEERPTVEIAARGLFQNLARDLTLTVARLDGLAVCDGCGNPYTPSRKPRKDRNNYCGPCRDAGVPARIRKRRQRARQRGETDG